MADYGYWAHDHSEVDHSAYDEYLDEYYDTDSIGLNYSGSRILKELDPFAYRVGFSDWLDMMITDGEIIEELPDPECEICGDEYPENELKDHKVYGLTCASCWD